MYLRCRPNLIINGNRIGNYQQLTLVSPHIGWTVYWPLQENFDISICVCNSDHLKRPILFSDRVLTRTYHIQRLSAS